MKLRLGLVMVAMLAVLALTPAQAEEPGYVGSEICSDCHEGYTEGLAATPHGRQGFTNLTAHGCESCHGPAELHLEDPEAFQRTKVFPLR